MFNKHFSISLALTILFVGFLFMQSAEYGFTQQVCCELPNGTCQDLGNANACESQGNNGTPFDRPPFECDEPSGRCVDTTPPPTGCCQQSPIGCDITTQGACDGVSWTETDATQCPTTGACEDVIGCCEGPGDQCGDATELNCRSNSGQWSAGLTCNDDNTCGPPPTGCCQDSPIGCDITTQAECDGVSWTETDALQCPTSGACEDVTGCCAGPASDECSDDTETFSTCGSNGGRWSAGVTCNDNDTCGPLNVTGCCQEDLEQCSETDFQSCRGEFFEDGSCIDGDTRCDDIPLGCCIISKNDCEFITEDVCDSLNGEYRGNGVVCSEVPECRVPPPTSAVPTISQWGMIAVAGMLGLFSLFVIIRRKELQIR